MVNTKADLNIVLCFYDLNVVLKTSIKASCATQHTAPINLWFIIY